MTAKQAIMEAINELPETVSIDDIKKEIERLEIIEFLDQAEQDIDEGRFHSAEDVRAELPSWISK